MSGTPSDKPALDEPEVVVPLAAEELAVTKERVERAKVRVTTKVVEHEERVRLALEHDDVEVVRVPVDRPVSERPAIREEEGTTIIPLVEEILVVETRLVVREEIHIRRKRRVEPVERTVILHSEEAMVEREPLSPQPPIEPPEE
ncbi:MAG TPA: DUF2382 domain-containing protein [Azospirillaceae bacterium]|nr:DUF2382 domain-containing protein [Azospirillaceae bacterium]